MSVNDAFLLSYRDLSGQSKNVGIAPEGRKGCTKFGRGLPFPKVDSAMCRPQGVPSGTGSLMSKSSICPRNGPPQWVDRTRCGAGTERVAGQEPAGNELISVRRGAAIESLAFRTIGDSLSGIIRQQRIRDSGSWRSASRARIALDGTRKFGSLLGLWRCGALFMRPF